jgi:hypothetical protein
VAGKVEASDFEFGREMVGDETVVRRFSVTSISLGVWLHAKYQHYVGD